MRCAVLLLAVCVAAAVATTPLADEEDLPQQVAALELEVSHLRILATRLIAKHGLSVSGQLPAGDSVAPAAPVAAPSAARRLATGNGTAPAITLQVSFCDLFVATSKQLDVVDCCGLPSRRLHSVRRPCVPLCLPALTFAFSVPHRTLMQGSSSLPEPPCTKHPQTFSRLTRRSLSLRMSWCRAL